MPTYAFTTTNVFPDLSLFQPVAIASPQDGSERLFVAEKQGLIVAITNWLAPTRTIFLDLSSRVLAGGEQGLLSLAFHPQYASNGSFYVYYTLNTETEAGRGRHQRLSRFQVSRDDAQVALAASEQPMITQWDPDATRNGGDLQFGPDGYLYLSAGDGGGWAALGESSRRIDRDFVGGILRLDVDQLASNLPPSPHPAVSQGTYRVPADNPWVGAFEFLGQAVETNRLRAEFFAVGLRQPWRISFDEQTGVLWCGDVGEGGIEEVNRIERGGHYGWPFREGLRAGPAFRDAPTDLESIGPAHAYEHGDGVDQGRAVVGGRVDRSLQRSQLVGAYVFGDFVTGNIWAVPVDSLPGGRPLRIARDPGVVAFGVDPRRGELLLVDHHEGRIKRLIHTTATSGDPVPTTLAETGFVGSTTDLSVLPGWVPYEVNVPAWHDGAGARRWLALPSGEAGFEFSVEGPWGIPAGTVWVQHLELQMTNGLAESARPVETRFLVRHALGAYGLSYRWDETGTNATLVADEGAEEVFRISEGSQVRTQRWRFPSRAECLSCHNEAAGSALGMNAAQLHRSVSVGGSTVDQLGAWQRAGYLKAELEPFAAIRPLVTVTNQEATLQTRLRSYFAVNCAACHRPGGPGRGRFDVRLSTPTTSAGLINGLLWRDRGSIRLERRVIRPGWPQFSEALRRMMTTGSGRMPPHGSMRVDQAAVEALTHWIVADTPNIESFEEWQIVIFNGTDLPEAGAGVDVDRDGASNYLEYLAGSNPLLGFDRWQAEVTRVGSRVQLRFPQRTDRGYLVEYCDRLEQETVWRVLPVPSNRIHYPTLDTVGLVEDEWVDGRERYYRVRIFEQ